MIIIRSYLQGARFSNRAWQLTSLLYVVNLLFALVLAIPFYKAFGETAGHTMALDSFIQTFRYTAIREFLSAFAERAGILLKTGIWLALLFLLVQILLKGGILSLADHKDPGFAFSRFMEGAGTWFFRFLKISLWVILLQVFILALVWIPFGFLLDHQFQHASTERVLYHTFLIAAGIHVVLASLVHLLGEYTRYRVFLGNGTRIFRTLLSTARMLIRRFAHIILLFLFMVIHFLLLSLLYYFLRKWIGAEGTWLLILLFIVQQLVMWLRNMLRIWMISSQLHLASTFLPTEGKKA